jgi:hypothetical protein
MAWIVALVFIVAFVGIALAVYSRSGSDVSSHPINEESAGEAPGAAVPSDVSGHDEGEESVLDQRGTR